MNNKRKEKLGDFSRDIAKYITTAVILATWFKGADTWKWYDFLVPIVVVVAVTWFGLYLIGNNEK